MSIEFSPAKPDIHRPCLIRSLYEHPQSPWRRLSARQRFHACGHWPTGRAGNMAMASEHSGQGGQNRLLLALTSEDHSLLAPHLKEQVLKVGSHRRRANRFIKFIFPMRE